MMNPQFATKHGQAAKEIPVSMSSGVFDTLPQSGAIITLLSICKLTHRQSYLNIAAMTIIVPLFTVAVVITLGAVFGSF